MQEMNLCSKEDDFSANLMRAVVRKASDKTKNKKTPTFSIYNIDDISC